MRGAAGRWHRSSRGRDEGHDVKVPGGERCCTHSCGPCGFRERTTLPARSGSRDRELADFERPPVVEVVLGVQFAESIVDLEVLAEFAVAIKSEFPNREQVETIPRSSESFSRPPEGPHIAFRLGGPPMPRTWFLSTDRRFLVQLQADRLTLNWRRVEIGDEYPRYAALRPLFDDLRGRLYEILKGLGRATPPVDHVEVSYINELASPDNWGVEAHPPLAAMLTTVAEIEADGFLPPPEDVGYMARFRIPPPHGTEEPVGRLLVSTERPIVPPTNCRSTC